MKLLARRKFQEKIGISFALLIGLIAVNTIVAGLVAYSITLQSEQQKEIEEIIQDVDRIRLAVSHFTSSLDRGLAEQVFRQIDSTRQRIKEAAPRHGDGKLSSLFSQLDDFKARFQKYMVEVDQMAALESRAVALGHSMLVRINGAKADQSDFANHQVFDAIVGRALNIMWQVQELLSRTHKPSDEQVSRIKAEQESLKILSRKEGDSDTQRMLFRIVRDIRDYVASYERHLLYRDRNADTERALFQISAHIHADCDDISSEMDVSIRRYITFATTFAILLFLTTLVVAPLLARYLTGQILNPILKLVSITKQVAAGHLDVRANAQTDDAIGRLSHYFNLMTKSLKSSQEELLEKHHALEEAHEELERRVEMRTQELAVSNASLQSEIIARKRSEAEIRSSEEKFRAMFELSPLGMARNSLDGHFLEANQSLQHMLGYDLESLRQCRLSDLYTEVPAIDWNDLVSSIREFGIYSLREAHIQCRDGRTIYMRLNGVLIVDSDGLESIWSICEDITEQKKSEEVIWNQANFDPLTGLPNRRKFQNSLDREIKNCNRQSHLMALMFLDLDKFKEVNDSLGHDKGDLLLIEAARRIAGCLRETDVVSRLGGDEFTVILPSLDSMSSVERVARKIIDVIAQPFELTGDKVFIGVSIGISLYPSDADSMEELMIRADQAMYQAKAEGRNRFCYYTHALQELSQKRVRLINDLRDAIKNEQLELYYQPIIELANGDIYKAEALIRWHHPDFGLITPLEFIPLAEETGTIAEIGDWVFRKAVNHVKHLRGYCHPQFQISINKSPIQFRTDQLYAEGWFAFINSLDLCDQAIVIEITEELLRDATDHVKNRLSEYRDAGLQLSLDNFGSGYSSLAYLNRYNIDYLKIDRAFVRHLAPNSNEFSLCEAITLSAHRLGLKVIAEGVENSLQHNLLLAAGCDYAQGFFYSRPLPIDEFEVFLSSSYCSDISAKNEQDIPLRK